MTCFESDSGSGSLLRKFWLRLRIYSGSVSGSGFTTLVTYTGVTKEEIVRKKSEYLYVKFFYL